MYGRCPFPRALRPTLLINRSYIHTSKDLATICGSNSVKGDQKVCGQQGKQQLYLRKHRVAVPVKKAQGLSLPVWLEERESSCIQNVKPRNSDLIVPETRLRKIRPFSANQLSVFHANARALAIPSRKNDIIKHLWKLRVSPAYKKANKHRLVITANVTRHMLEHTSCEFGNILTSSEDLLEHISSNPTYKDRYKRLQLVDRSILKYCLRGTSFSVDRVDTLAEVVVPPPQACKDSRLVIALDNIRYPSNIGNIIRTAVALNVDSLFYLKGTADPFDWKVSQITGGLQFMLPYSRGDVRDLKQFCKTRGLVPLVAHLEGDSVEEVPVDKGVCIILSNESKGPEPAILRFAKRITLPMHPLVNSLNVSVAAAILIHQVQERLCQLSHGSLT